MEQLTVDQKIRAVLDQHARLAVRTSELDSSADLYAAGMTSLSSVNVMLALEEEFDLEFPERLLNKSTFASVDSIRQGIEDAEHG